MNEGGQRCASHTRRAEKKARKRLAAATRRGDRNAVRAAEAEWLTAATAYASTDEGAESLNHSANALFAAGHLQRSALVDVALRRGRDLREANRAAAEAIREAREEQQRRRDRAAEYDRAYGALADTLAY